LTEARPVREASTVMWPPQRSQREANAEDPLEQFRPRNPGRRIRNGGRYLSPRLLPMAASPPHMKPSAARFLRASAFEARTPEPARALFDPCPHRSLRATSDVADSAQPPGPEPSPASLPDG
jgi:hypothetical protein